jgi:uncharacterized protein with PQ loop repeat
MTLLNKIVHEQLYKYFAMAFATLFLIPQIRLGATTKSVKDLSVTSLIMIIFASTLWALYLKEEKLYPYLAATLVVFTSAGTLLIMSFKFYWDRVNNHMKSFDKPVNIKISDGGTENQV